MSGDLLSRSLNIVLSSWSQFSLRSIRITKINIDRDFLDKLFLDALSCVLLTLIQSDSSRSTRLRYRILLRFVCFIISTNVRNRSFSVLTLILFIGVRSFPLDSHGWISSVYFWIFRETCGTIFGLQFELILIVLRLHQIYLLLGGGRLRLRFLTHGAVLRSIRIQGDSFISWRNDIIAKFLI